MFMMYNALKSHLKFSIINELIGGGKERLWQQS
jgi:hypothetical protein